MGIYLDNKYFEATIKNYLEARQAVLKANIQLSDPNGVALQGLVIDLPKLTRDFNSIRDILTGQFLLLCTRLVERYCANIVIDHDDSIQDCAMICLKRIDNFQPAKGKAFNFFTTCIIHHLRQLYRTHQSYQGFLRKLAREKYPDADVDSETVQQHGYERGWD
jgi:hypothetical protein